MITLTDKNNTSHNYETDSYLLLTFEGERIKATGDINVRALGPILIKLAMEKFAK